jgi:carbohydrate kinase (thermoresistant glucokinase family)
MKSDLRSTEPLVIVVMGVSGCGKSTVAKYLAEEISAHFKDGDELHPPANIDKMAAGTPLSDEDRNPWLHDVARYAQEHAEKHRCCVIACSALKHCYRQILNTAGNVAFVFLDGSRELIASRMHERRGHFMPLKLLDSQFEALEDPGAEPNVLTVSIEPQPDAIAAQAASELRDHGYID